MRAGSFAPWRAGGFVGNHLIHSSFMPANSSSSAITMVTLTILSIELPASSRIAWMFVKHCRVCSWIVVPLYAPVAGSVGAVPETKTKPAAFTAWLYVGGGFAAFGVNTICRGTGLPSNGEAAKYCVSRHNAATARVRVAQRTGNGRGVWHAVKSWTATQPYAGSAPRTVRSRTAWRSTRRSLPGSASRWQGVSRAEPKQLSGGAAL